MADMFRGDVGTGEEMQRATLVLAERFLELLNLLRENISEFLSLDDEEQEQEEGNFFGEFEVTWEGESISSPEQVTSEMVEALAEISELKPGAVSSKVRNVEIWDGDLEILEVKDGIVTVNERVAPGVRFEQPEPQEDLNKRSVVVDFTRSGEEEGLRSVRDAVERLNPSREKELLQELIFEIGLLRDGVLRDRDRDSNLVDIAVEGEADPKQTASTLRDLCDRFGTREGYRGVEYSVLKSGKDYSVVDSSGEELMQFRQTFWGATKIETSADPDEIAALHLKASSLKGDLDAGRSPGGAFASAAVAEAVSSFRRDRLIESFSEMARNGERDKSQFEIEGYRIVASKQGGVRIEATHGRGTIFQRSNDDSSDRLSESDIDRLEKAIPFLQFEFQRQQQQQQSRPEVSVTVSTAGVKDKAPERKSKEGFELD